MALKSVEPMDIWIYGPLCSFGWKRVEYRVFLGQYSFCNTNQSDHIDDLKTVESFFVVVAQNRSIIIDQLY